MVMADPSDHGHGKKGTHHDTGITPGQLGKLLKPRSGDYLGHRKATFRDKLLLVGSHIQRLACHDMGSQLHTSRGHANSQTRTVLEILAF